MQVKVSAKSARQLFHGCEPDYIRDVCKGACCRSSTAPTGILVSVHPSEQAALEALGDRIQGGRLLPLAGQRRCPHQEQGTNLCGLHGQPEKPFGCIASPFTLNANGTLIVRNRYRMLKCYKDGPNPKPAYVAFRASLDLIFGPAEAARIAAHLDAGGGDLQADMPARSYEMLTTLDAIKKEAPVTTRRGVAPQELEQSVVPISNLAPYPGNPRQGDVGAIIQSLERHGQYRPLVVQRSTMRVLAGNHTLEAARQLGWREVAVTLLDVDDDQAARIVAVDNRTNDLASYDTGALLELLTALPDLEGTGYDADDLDDLLADLNGEDRATKLQRAEATLAQRFVVPPFSVLDSRQGYWQERKRAWVELGIQSELGRGADTVPNGSTRGPDQDGAWQRSHGSMPSESAQSDFRQRKGRYGGPRVPVEGEGGLANKTVGKKADARTFGQDLMRGEGSWQGGVLMKSASGNDPSYYAKKQAVEKRLGRELTNEEFERDHYAGPDSYASGTSIFDPVLCELAYRWFCPAGGSVLDPFAGGSVRGIVAARLGHPYTGIDLRAEQVDANEVQADQLLRPGDPRPTWHVGDALQVLLPGGDGHGLDDLGPYDLVFTCPPYFDLERYSDDPADLSTMDTDAFLEAYGRVISLAADRLADNRFMVLVVSEVRGKDGHFRGLVPETIRLAARAGLRYYNEAVLINAVGSLAVRAPKQFQASRKLGRTHQLVLGFFKGDPKTIRATYGDVEVGQVDEEQEA